ncbi:hypothetical protein N7451_000138 [Penicillium sp. IBT 35674x]|nr:hypothetical protein N7451_000138 [Penicillium sp. IBT 35674x]
MDSSGFWPFPGDLPIEQFMIRNWDYGCPQPANVQRMHLIAEFLRQPRIPRSWYHPERIIRPTEAQINLILRGWRGENVRQLAWFLWQGAHEWPVLMRTHYDPTQPHHELMMQQWIALGEKYDTDHNRCWNVINHPSFFGMPERIPHEFPDWRRILALLPEIAGPEAVFIPECDTIRWSDLPPWHKYRRDLFKEQVLFEKESKPREWNENPFRVIERCAAGLQYAMAAMFIIVVDQQAFITGRPMLLYLDHHGNEIRSTRFEFTEMTLLGITTDWFAGHLTPWMWENSEVGECYEAQGEVGRVLYQLDELDLAPPTRRG